MALSQILTVLHSDRRRRHTRRLVPPHSSNPSSLDFADVHLKKARCNDHIPDRMTVVFDILFTRKPLSRKLIFVHSSAAIASILSLTYRVQLQHDASDVTWKVGYVLLWSLDAPHSPSIIPPRSVREIILDRQVEMFAGVSASSMPSVYQFFIRHNLSLAAKWWSLKSIFMGSSTSSTKVKLRDRDPNPAESGRNSTHMPGRYKGTRRNDLELDDYEPKTLPSTNSQYILHGTYM